MNSPTPEVMTPGDRRQLIAVVKQRMRVLRAEVKQREAELTAEADQRLVEKYAGEDKRADELAWRMQEIAKEANQTLRDALREFEDLVPDGRWARGMVDGFGVPRIYRQSADKPLLRAALHEGIKAQVRQALLELDRQEAELLISLAVDALQTEAARQFIAAIPTVAQLVPSARLREIEANFDEGGKP